MTWRTARRGLYLVVAAALALVAWSLVAALGARADLQQARQGLQGLQASGTDLDEVAGALGPARGEARSAVRRMRQPGPLAVESVPVLGRSLRAERVTAEAVLGVLDAAHRLVPLAADLQPSPGKVDLAQLDRVRAELAASGEALHEPLRQLQAVPLGMTPGPVARAVREVQGELDGLDTTFVRSADGLSAMAGMLGAQGPRTLVVAVMNNAELRGAGGYASSLAVVTARDGQVSIGPFQDVNEIEDTPKKARKVPAPADFTARWGRYLADTTLWKNVLMSPDVPASAQVACSVATLAPGVPCDGVVLLDVPVLSRLATITGPVKVPKSGALSGEDLLRGLLVDQYDAVPKGGQQDRRAALRAAADDALTDLVSRPLPVADLLRVLRDGGHGRHVAVWSSRPEEQAALMRAGVAGSADPQGDDLALVAVNQFSIAKLDYYVRRTVDVDVEVGRDRALVRQRVTFSLEMPTDLSPYVTGKYDRHLVGLADIAVAADADVAAVRRDDVAVNHTLLRDTGSQRVELHLDLADGASTTYEVAYSVPVRDGRYALRLLPQPLAHDAQLRLAVRPARGLELAGGPVRYDGPFDRSRRVEVQLSEPRGWPWQ